MGITTALLLALLACGAAWLLRGHLLSGLEALLYAVLPGPRPRASPVLAAFAAPVERELLAADLSVEGTLPAECEGVFAAIGPNPAHVSPGGHHWVDGDGMVTALRLKGGKAAFGNAFVQTSRLQQERRAGRALFPRLFVHSQMGQLYGVRGAVASYLSRLKLGLGLLDISRGGGPANAALVFHNKQLLALHPADLPYAVRVHGDARVETLERLTYDGRLRPSFAAHPMKDPDTGVLYGFGCQASAPPAAHYFAIDASGVARFDAPVPALRPGLGHALAITQRYALLLDFPMLADPRAMVRRGGFLWRLDKAAPTRIHVLERDSPQGRIVQTFELPAMFGLHVANAWEEGPTIRLFVCLADEYDFGATAESPAFLEELRLDMAGGGAQRRRLWDHPCAHPTVPAALVGRKTRYLYAAATHFNGHGPAGAVGLIKVDLEAEPGAGSAGAVTELPFPPACVGNPAAFVPRRGWSRAREDSGYLLTICTDAAFTSRLQVFSAQALGAQPLAAVWLPQRVPSHPHSLHLSEAEFEGQFPFDLHFLPLPDL